jgi:hypothetical protein
VRRQLKAAGFLVNDHGFRERFATIRHFFPPFYLGEDVFDALVPVVLNIIGVL